MLACNESGILTISHKYHPQEDKEVQSVGVTPKEMLFLNLWNDMMHCSVSLSPGDHDFRIFDSTIKQLCSTETETQKLMLKQWN